MKQATRDKAQIIDQATLERLEQQLVSKHGEQQRQRIRRGLRQVAQRWREQDGGAEEMTKLATEHFISDPEALQDTFEHLQYALEMLNGHAYEVQRELSRFQVLDEGPLRPVDQLLAAYSPAAHIQEDLFRGGIAAVALLNFPITTLQHRLSHGHSWPRKTWAQARLTGYFEHRVPAEVVQQIDRVSAAVEGYIDGYNIQMDRVVDAAGKKPFRSGLKLISHWGLRDELKGQYQRGGEGLASQRLIAQIMERIIHQQIPAGVIDSDRLEWDVERNLVRQPGGSFKQADREPDTRYRFLLDVMQAKRRLDPFYPDAPTHMDRVFELGREMPESRMRKLLQSILAADVAKEAAAVIKKRLGRPLEPFDIWYAGFRSKPKLSEPDLDKITRARFPDAKAFEQALPQILQQLGFSKETAAYLGSKIEVDPARGAGHAAGARRRQDNAHLRTRIREGGMTYKGYNIAIHELGHNVEQVFSMSRVDHTLLEGVPNTGFTEAFAFLFQARDLELLGQAANDPMAEAMHLLDRYWAAFEIAGVGLLDMDIWHWMYDHPRATPAELRQATVKLAQKLWNRYYAPVLGVKDSPLLAIYSHIIAYGLYTPDYPLGKIITTQIEQYMKGRSLGTEMERMCRLGRLAPDVWMQQAVGSDVSSRPLIEAAQAAVKQVESNDRGE